MSICFILLPAVVEFHATLRQVHWMTLTWHWTLQSKDTSRTVCVNGVTNSESQSAICFALRPAVFESEAILWRLHEMTVMWPRTLEDQRHPMYMHALLASIVLLESKISIHFCSTARRSWVTIHFERSAWSYPETTLDTRGQRYPIYGIMVNHNPKFHPVSLYGLAFPSYMQFETIAHNGSKWHWALWVQR